MLSVVTLANGRGLVYRGGRALKQIEHNKEMMISINSKDLSAWHADITSSKSDNELLLFGEEVNSMIEFYQEPSSYSSSPTAIRMAKVYYDDNHRYIIQACHIENYENVWKDLEQKYPLLPVDTIGPLKTAKKQMSLTEFKKLALEQYTVNRYDKFVSEDFARKLYNIVNISIKRFTIKGKLPSLFARTHETSYVFRCIVGDELWTLSMYMPEGYYKELSKLFSALESDIRYGHFNEQAYIEQLDDLKKSISN